MHPVVVWTAIATIHVCVCAYTGKGSACNVTIQTEGAYRIEGKFTIIHAVYMHKRLHVSKYKKNTATIAIIIAVIQIPSACRST